MDPLRHKLNAQALKIKNNTHCPSQQRSQHSCLTEIKRNMQKNKWAVLMVWRCLDTSFSLRRLILAKGRLTRFLVVLNNQYKKRGSKNTFFWRGQILKTSLMSRSCLSKFKGLKSAKSKSRNLRTEAGFSKGSKVFWGDDSVLFCFHIRYLLCTPKWSIFWKIWPIQNEHRSLAIKKKQLDQWLWGFNSIKVYMLACLFQPPHHWHVAVLTSQSPPWSCNYLRKFQLNPGTYPRYSKKTKYERISKP